MGERCALHTVFVRRRGYGKHGLLQQVHSPVPPKEIPSRSERGCAMRQRSMSISTISSLRFTMLRSGSSMLTLGACIAGVSPTDMFASGIWLLYLRSNRALPLTHGGSFEDFIQASCKRPSLRKYLASVLSAEAMTRAFPSQKGMS